MVTTEREWCDDERGRESRWRTRAGPTGLKYRPASCRGSKKSRDASPNSAQLTTMGGHGDAETCWSCIVPVVRARVQRLSKPWPTSFPFWS